MFFGRAKKLKEEIVKLEQDLNDLSAYLEEILNFLPISLCELSPLGIISSVNRVFETFSGYDSLEIIGRDIFGLFQEKIEINELLEIAKRKKIVKADNLTFIKKDGEKRIVEAHFFSKEDNQGNLTGFFVSLIDVTSLREFQKEMERKIKERTEELELSRKALLNILEDTELARIQAEEERKKTEAILFNFTDGILVFNLKKELEFVNPKAEELLKIKKEEIIGKTLKELKNFQEIKELTKLFGEELKEVFRQEIHPQKDLYLEVTSTFALLNNEKIAFFVILHDISREKLIEEMKTQFVSVAAHQLRTPLSIIKWSLNMLLEGDVGPLSEEQKEFLLKTYQTNERMINLINDLLDVTRIEEGRFIYQPRIIEFDQLVQRVFDSLKDLASQKEHSYRLIIKKSKKPKIVKVDVEKMELVLKNLIENAIKYTPQKGKIIVTLERKGNEILCSVKDTGVGIPKDQQNRVFARFFRGANVIKMETEGSGLGLFIAKNIIEAHGGKIWFESEENKGTTFFFTLPTII